MSEIQKSTSRDSLLVICKRSKKVKHQKVSISKAIPKALLYMKRVYYFAVYACS